MQLPTKFPVYCPDRGKIGILGSMAGSVLIVDDSLVARLSLKGILKGSDWSLSEAASGEAALEKLSGGLAPDIVFLDLTMPGKGGIETLREIRGCLSGAPRSHRHRGHPGAHHSHGHRGRRLGRGKKACQWGGDPRRDRSLGGQGNARVTEKVEFSALELDALQETMNIGFGQAAAALSEVISMHVILSVPKIAILKTEDIPSFVQSEIEDPSAFSMVEQFFLRPLQRDELPPPPRK